MKPWSSEKISTLALTLLITGAIDSIRNLPLPAVFGASLIFFFLMSAVIFLIPVALISAELASTWPHEEGGIYSWVKHAFGDTWAFITIWLQWINTMVWYPTILSFIAGTLAYLIDPALASNKFYLIGTILTVFWSLTALALTGVRASARFAGLCAIVGIIIPMVLIIGLALVWILQGNVAAININGHTLLPDWKNSQSWVSLTAIMTSFLGMELAAVHVRDVKNPQRNFPRAMFFSAVLILTTMILGSLAIALVLPASQINLVDGVMQTFTQFFNAYHLNLLMPVVVVLLLLGSVGGMINWIISPAKGLALAAQNGFLPPYLFALNRHGVAYRILIAQAILVTLLCSGFLLLPSINAIYWLFTDLSTELYMLMYVLLFFAAIRIKRTFPALPRPFKIPGKKTGYYFICALGLIGCSITLCIGFIPPQSMDIGSTGHFRSIFTSGIALMLAPAFLLCWYKRLKIR